MRYIYDCLDSFDVVSTLSINSASTCNCILQNRAFILIEMSDKVSA